MNFVYIYPYIRLSLEVWLKILIIMLLYVLIVLAVRVASSLETLSNGWDPLDSVQDDYVSIAYPDGGVNPRLVNYVINSTVPSTGRPYTMYVAVLNSGLPSSFTLELPSQGVPTCVNCSENQIHSMHRLLPSYEDV